MNPDEFLQPKFTCKDAEMNSDEFTQPKLYSINDLNN